MKRITKYVIAAASAVILANPLTGYLQYVFDTEPQELIITALPSSSPSALPVMLDSIESDFYDEAADFSADETTIFEAEQAVEDTEPADSSEADVTDIDYSEPESVLRLESMTSECKNGSKATVSVIGKPDTEYSIKVVYKTVSKASGLEAKRSDSSGRVSWTWRVGVNTTPGEHPITIEGGGEVLELTFVTYKP